MRQALRRISRNTRAPGLETLAETLVPGEEVVSGSAIQLVGRSRYAENSDAAASR